HDQQHDEVRGVSRTLELLEQVFGFLICSLYSRCDIRQHDKRNKCSNECHCRCNVERKLDADFGEKPTDSRPDHKAERHGSSEQPHSFSTFFKRCDISNKGHHRGDQECSTESAEETGKVQNPQMGSEPECQLG